MSAEDPECHCDLDDTIYNIGKSGNEGSCVSARSAARSKDPKKPERVLSITLPSGIDPGAVPSVSAAMEKALTLMTNVGDVVVGRADRLAELATGLAEPSMDLVEERTRRMRTIRQVFEEGDWLTAEQINALQASPPSNKAHPASDWKRRGRIFSVNYGGREYFPRYEFDALYQPLPVIKEIIAAFGDVADAWQLAAWFHFPSPWLVVRDRRGARNIAPRDALADRAREVVTAAAKRSSSYIA
ncbi:MAG: hypothetical protein LT102_09425 [Burkholderiaceae bacterium]|nr:hypothetical protein [Burkholderiaceae bacterium]